MKERKIKFDYNVTYSLTNDKKKGTIIFELRINYELIKYIIETKGMYLSYLGKGFTKKGLYFDIRKEDQREALNKILNCKEYFVIKNIYIFDIVRPASDENNALRDKVKEDYVINNLKHNWVFNKSLPEKAVSAVFHAALRHYLYPNMAVHWEGELSKSIFFKYDDYSFTGRNSDTLSALYKSFLNIMKLLTKYFSRVFTNE